MKPPGWHGVSSRAAADPGSYGPRWYHVFLSGCGRSELVVLPNVESEAVHIIASKLHLCFGTSSLALKPWPYGCTPTATLEAS